LNLDENATGEFLAEVKGDSKVEWTHNGSIIKEGLNFNVSKFLNDLLN
jgi:hypothetical protein